MPTAAYATQRVAKRASGEAPQVARALGVKGFPTIKLFAGGKSTDYNGPRSAMALVSFAQAPPEAPAAGRS